MSRFTEENTQEIHKLKAEGKPVFWTSSPIKLLVESGTNLKEVSIKSGIPVCLVDDKVGVNGQIKFLKVAVPDPTKPSQQLQGWLPKAQVHDYVYARLNLAKGLTGITYGGDRWTAEPDFGWQRAFPFPQENSRCVLCASKANLHKVYETNASKGDAGALWSALLDAKWNANGKNTLMLGVMRVEGDITLATCSGQTFKGSSYEESFYDVVNQLDKSRERSRRWVFARAIPEEAPLRNFGGEIKKEVQKDMRILSHMECAAPKLIQTAHKNQLKIESMSEIWYVGHQHPTWSGAKLTEHEMKVMKKLFDGIAATTITSCEKCRRVLPFMLCPAPSASMEF